MSKTFAPQTFALKTFASQTIAPKTLDTHPLRASVGDFVAGLQALERDFITKFFSSWLNISGRDRLQQKLTIACAIRK